MKYGKCIEKPIQLNSIDSSLKFIESLVTEENGLYILAHRKYSKPFSGSIIDVYEIFSSTKKLDELYISIYFENNLLIPPDGYLFDADLIEDDNIPENYIFNKKNNNINIHAPLQKHLIKSKAINYRYKDFPIDMINELYLNNELLFIENISSIIKSINDDFQS